MTNGKSIGSVKDYTPNYKFIIPKFDIATWHDYMEKNFRNIDALFYNLFGINNYSGEWTKLTQYKTDQVLFIGEDKKDGKDTEYSGRLVKILQDHTTDNSEYFNIYYEQHPEYYELFADASTAQLFAQQAQQSAAEALQSEQNAKESETNSKNSEQIATQKAIEASGSASNAQQLVDTFESNVNSYTESFNSNAESKLNAYNANDTTKTDAFNQNYTEKLQSFNTNATEKTEIVNTKAQEAQTSATNAAISEQNAQNSENLAKEYADKAQIGSFGNIGDIKYTTRTDVPNGSAWCDGAEYTQSQFPDLYQMLVDGKIQSTTYQNFTSSVSANGYCEFFALNTSIQKFKVPSLPNKYVIDLNTTAPIKGTGMSIGLWNGTTTGTLSHYSNQGGTVARVGYGLPVGSTPSDYMDLNKTIGITTDSSKSGMIADTTNIKKIVTLKAYVVLYSSAAEASVVQAQEFMTALGGKANADLSNIPSNIDYVVESGESGGVWYRKYKSGWLEQGGFYTSPLDDTVKTITLMKPYANINYSAERHAINIKTDMRMEFAESVKSKTTTSISFLVSLPNIVDGYVWHTYGQGA